MSSHALPAKAESLFRNLFEQASLGIAVEDLDGKILVANPALCAMLGYRDDELHGMSCSEFANPEDSQDDWALFEQLRAGVIDHYTLEKRYKKKDGAPLWGRLNVSLLKQDDGESPLVFAFVENITEHKQAEDALHQQEKELAETQHLAGMGSWLWDARSDRMTWTSEIFLRTGNDPNSPAPKLKDLAGLFTPETWDRLQRSVQQAVQTGTSYEVDLELIRPLSGVRWATTRGKPLRAADGQVIGLRGTVQDITAHKLAEQKLAQNNDRFRLVLEASKSVAWEWDQKNGQLSWFGDLQSMFGIASDSFVGRMDDFYSYVHAEDRPMVAKVVADARKNRKRYAAEFRVVRGDGMVRWVAARGSFYYEANGDPVRMLGMATDITRRKETDERLREYEKAVEGSTDSITVIDREYRYLIANRAFLKLRNMASEQVVGHLVPEVLNKGVFEAVVKDKLDECFAGKIVKFELRYRYPEIGERDLLLSYFPIESSGGIDRVACIAQDITERKQAQDELRESEQRLRLAVQAGKMYVFDWDVVNDVIVRSKESAGILNWIDPEHDTGRDFHARIHPDDLALYTATEAKLTPENPAYQICFRTRGSNGSITWLEDTGRAFFDAQRKVVRVIGIVGDITERKLAGAALANVSRKLIEAQEQERTRIGRELHDDIGQRLALVAVEMQQMHDDPITLARARRRLAGLRKKITEIAADTQSLSHELHSARLQYLGIAAAMKGFCREFGEKQKVKIDFNVHDLPSPLSADISLCLFRVLQEALHNAVKHSGGHRFEVRLWGTADEMHLTIKDFGRGFDREAAKTSQGIGLISMEERLKGINGTLAVDSQPGRGTTIEARVPVSFAIDSLRATG